MFMVKTMRFRLFFIGAFALDMCCPPGFLWNNRLVLPIYQHIIICSDNMIFISCSWNFFIMSASVSYFSEIYRIINNANDKCTGERFKFVVMPLDFSITVFIQPICDLLCPHDGFFLNPSSFLILLRLIGERSWYSASGKPIGQPIRD